MCNLMRSILIIILILKLSVVLGQPTDLFSFPEIIKEGPTIMDFVPNRWTLLDSTSGDLNGDNRIDVAIVVQSKDSLETFTHGEYLGEEYVIVNRSEKYQRRILLILFKDSLTNKFNLIEQSNTIILCHKDIKWEDRFKEIKIENGLLRIHYGSSTYGNDLYFSAHYFFKYQKAEFLLTRAYLDKVVTPNIQITHSFDFITKKWIKTQGVINSGQGHKETLKDLNNIENKTLKTFERPFTWFIAGVYL